MTIRLRAVVLRAVLTRAGGTIAHAARRGSIGKLPPSLLFGFSHVEESGIADESVLFGNPNDDALYWADRRGRWSTRDATLAGRI